VTILKKKNDTSRVFVLNLYDKIAQTAVYKILYVVFEGYFCWEKVNKKIVRIDYCEAIDYRQIVKRKGRKEY
jgi:hypothetical protein